MNEQISMKDFLDDAQREMDAMRDRAIVEIGTAVRANYRALIEAFCSCNNIAMDDLQYPDERDVARFLAAKTHVASDAAPPH